MIAFAHYANNPLPDAKGYAAAPDTLKLTQLKPSSNASILYTKEYNLPVKKKQPMKMAMAP